MIITRKTKYTVALIIAFSIAMITFRHEFRVQGFVSLVVSISLNVILFYKYRTEKEYNIPPKNESR